ncbi:hypothetical protein FQA39_LY14342 [Lamprigera yunnana]|nr:hypothetical protein FQA39_LY14342 [Lamprigera yunnana]
MKLIICAFTLVSAAWAGRVVGGEDADIADFPYQISLQVSGGHSCGGTILTPIKILTAAHCTQFFTLDSLSVRAGSSLREEGGQVVNALKKIEHPEYNYLTVENDIAIVVLEQPLIFNDKVQTIEVLEDDDVPVGTLATLTGWGVTETGLLAKHLQKLVVPRVDDSSCEASYPGYKPNTQLCYGGILGQDACSASTKFLLRNSNDV